MNIFPFSELRRRFMDSTMTRYTKRNNIKRLRIVGMMIFLGLIPTYTTMVFGYGRQFARYNSITYLIMGYCSLAVCFTIFAFIYFCGNFVIIRFFIFRKIITKFLAYCVFMCATFTFGLMPIFIFRCFMKLTKWFILLANRASFRYDLVSHFNFLNKLFWLKPVSGHIPASGLFYYRENTVYVK